MVNEVQYLVFIPLLLYGITLSDLLNQSRRFYKKENIYWPFILTVLVFTEVAIWNVYIYLDFANELIGISYRNYWMYLVQPITFLLVVHALIPDKDEMVTEASFRKRMPLVFGFMALYIGIHLVPRVAGVESLNIQRLIAVLVCVVLAISRKPSLVYGLLVFWIVSFFFRG